MAIPSTVKVSHENDFKFKVNCRDHEIVTDLPAAGSKDAGPTPPELFIASLGSCIGIYVVDYCKRHNVPYKGMTVELGWEDAKAPLRIGSIVARVEMPEGIPQEHYEKLRRVAEMCKIHNTLTHTPSIKMILD
jgi:putative redox protein